MIDNPKWHKFGRKESAGEYDRQAHILAVVKKIRKNEVDIAEFFEDAKQLLIDMETEELLKKVANNK